VLIGVGAAGLGVGVGAAAWRAAGHVGGSRQRLSASPGVVAGGSPDPAHIPDFRGVEMPQGAIGKVTHTAFADGSQERVVDVSGYPAGSLQANQFSNGSVPFQGPPAGTNPRSASDGMGW
jgi:hypothetical protein